MKLQELTLPEFAFIEGYKTGNELEGRTVILHTRTASVIEVFNRNDVVFNEGVLTYNFGYINKFGVREPMTAALHYCATMDVDSDGYMIKNEILKSAAKWYCDYCTWEDKNITIDK